MSERLLIVPCGLAFAGKSTLARAIARRTGAAIVSLDEINARRGLVGGDGVAEVEWAATGWARWNGRRRTGKLWPKPRA